jgi:hypothetical protein
MSNEIIYEEIISDFLYVYHWKVQKGDRTISNKFSLVGKYNKNILWSKYFIPYYANCIKTTIAKLTIIICMLFPLSADAQDKKISYVEQNKPAPFAGYLLSPAAFAEMKVAASTQEALFEAKLEYELGKQKANSDFQIAQLKADNNFLSRENEMHLKNVEYWQKKSKRTVWESIDAQVGLGAGFILAYFTFHTVLKVSGDK